MSVYSTFFACIILDRESVTMHDLGALCIYSNWEGGGDIHFQFLCGSKAGHGPTVKF